MLCSEVMHKEVAFVREDDNVRIAAEKMRDREIGFVPVCSAESNGLVGTLTDRDITVRLAAAGKSIDTPVRDIMTTAPIFCHTNQEIAEAHNLMQSHQVSRVIVLDEDNHLAGVISLADIAANGSSEETLREIKHP
jgi:CBS domain-containing protein